MRVSWITGLPSAMIETHVVCSARMSKMKVLSGGPGEGGAIFAADRVAGSGAGDGLETTVVAVDAFAEAGADAAGDFATAGFEAAEAVSILGELAGADVVTGAGACALGADEIEGETAVGASSRRR